MIRYCVNADPKGWDRCAISVYSDLEPGLEGYIGQRVSFVVRIGSCEDGGWRLWGPRRSGEIMFEKGLMVFW